MFRNLKIDGGKTTRISILSIHPQSLAFACFEHGDVTSDCALKSFSIDVTSLGATARSAAFREESTSSEDLSRESYECMCCGIGDAHI